MSGAAPGHHRVRHFQPFKLSDRPTPVVASGASVAGLSASIPWQGFKNLFRQAYLSLNRPRIAGGFNLHIGWSHDEQDDEQVFT